MSLRYLDDPVGIVEIDNVIDKRMVRGEFIVVPCAVGVISEIDPTASKFNISKDDLLPEKFIE